MNYTKGEFQHFRAITKIHLGAISDNLYEGEEVAYDGYTMKRGEDDHALHTLRAAVKVGWLVPVEAPETQYVPQPAGVKVHRADGLSTEEIGIPTITQEDVYVGDLREVRPDNALPMHKASKAGELRSEGKPDKPKNPDEGVVVSTFKTAAKAATVEVGKDDRRIVQELDNKTSVDAERTAIATGDVDEPIGGHDLTELLPDAASSGTPEAGVAGEGRGDEADSRAAQINTSSESPLAHIRQFIPGFEWDMDIQWAKRAKIACEKYGHIPPVLAYIKSVETDTVKKHIESRMAGNK